LSKDGAKGVSGVTYDLTGSLFPDVTFAKSPNSEHWYPICTFRFTLLVHCQFDCLRLPVRPDFAGASGFFHHVNFARKFKSPKIFRQVEANFSPASQVFRRFW
jgi:hypothetical protein